MERKTKADHFRALESKVLLIVLNALGKGTTLPVPSGKYCYILITLWKGKLGSLLLILILFARSNPFLRQVRIILVSKSVQDHVFSTHCALFFPAPVTSACWVAFPAPILCVLHALVPCPSFHASSL